MAALRGNFNFTPTVLPLAGSPKEEFSQLMDSRIAAFDEGVASENLTTNMLSTYDVAAGEEGRRNAIALDAEQKLKALAEEFQGAYEDPQFRMRQAALTRQLVKNKDLNTLTQNKVNYDLYNKLKIEDPTRLDFNSWRNHIDSNKGGELSVFTPQLETRENYTAFADEAIKPHITYINENNKSGFSVLAPGEGKNTTESYMIIKTDGTVFNIHDNSRESKEMRQLLRDHALPIFEKSKGGDQLARALGTGLIQDRNLEDISGDQSKVSEELLNTLIDRFPGVRTQKTSISTTRPYNTGGGSGGDKTPEDERPFSFNETVPVEEKVDADEAYEVLEGHANEQRGNLAMTPEDKAAIKDFKEDPSGNIAYDGQPPSDAARAHLTTSLSKSIGKQNAENTLTAIVENAAAYVKTTKPDFVNPIDLWEDPTDFNSLNKANLAIVWFGQEAFDQAAAQAAEDEGIFDGSYWKGKATDAWNTLSGSIIDTYNEFSADNEEEVASADALEKEREAAQAKELKERYENRGAMALLEGDERWEKMISDRDQTALVAIEQNTTSFPRTQFDLYAPTAGKVNEAHYALNAHIKNNVNELEFYDAKSGVDKGGIVSKVKEGKAEFQILDFLTGGARELNKDGYILGPRDPGLMEVGALYYKLDNKGERVGVGEKIKIRGYNIDKQIIEHLATPDQINAQSLRSSMANIVENGLIPNGGYYRLTPNELNTAFRTLPGKDIDYLKVYNRLANQGLTSLSALDGNSAGNDLLNLAIQRHRTEGGQDTYSLNFLSGGVWTPLKNPVKVNGDYKEYKAVSEREAPDLLAGILHDYFYDLLNDYSKPAEEQ